MRSISTFTALVLLIVSAKVFCQELPPPVTSWELRITSDIAIQSYNLTGESFKATDTGSSGASQSVEILWQRPGYRLHANYKNLSLDANSPNGLSPDKVRSRWQRGLFSYEIETANQMIFQLGLDHRSRESTDTTPNQFMPTRSHTGIRIGALFNHPLITNFRFEFGGGLMVPFLISETSASTGQFRFGANPDLNLNLIYKVNHFIDFSVGAHWMMEHTSFAGSGSRGTQDATESFHNFLFPVELRFQF